MFYLHRRVIFVWTKFSRFQTVFRQTKLYFFHQSNGPTHNCIICTRFNNGTNDKRPTKKSHFVDKPKNAQIFIYFHLNLFPSTEAHQNTLVPKTLFTRSNPPFHAFDFRSGCMQAWIAMLFAAKRPSLKLKTWPEQLLLCSHGLSLVWTFRPQNSPRVTHVGRHDIQPNESRQNGSRQNLKKTRHFILSFSL